MGGPAGRAAPGVKAGAAGGGGPGGGGGAGGVLGRGGGGGPGGGGGASAAGGRPERLLARGARAVRAETPVLAAGVGRAVSPSAAPSTAPAPSTSTPRRFGPTLRLVAGAATPGGAAHLPWAAAAGPADREDSAAIHQYPAAAGVPG